MNELQEFFQSVAIEKKKVAEEQARIQAREERLQPQVKVELTDLSEFFGTMATAKRNLKPKTIQDVVTPAKPEQTKMHLELESFFNRLSNFSILNILAPSLLDFDGSVCVSRKIPSTPLTIPALARDSMNSGLPPVTPESWLGFWTE